jgi:hypothetical protein
MKNYVMNEMISVEFSTGTTDYMAKPRNMATLVMWPTNI